MSEVRNFSSFNKKFFFEKDLFREVLKEATWSKRTTNEKYVLIFDSKLEILTWEDFRWSLDV